MPMDRPSTHEAYLELVRQAMLEAGKLHSRNEENRGEAMGVAERLENNLKSLYASLIGGSYQHADEDLDFVDIINTLPDTGLPFKQILQVINQTHRQGLDAE